VVNDFEIQLFDLTSWEAIGLLHPPTLVRCNAVSFSRDGTRLASACARGRLRLWALDEIRDRLRAAHLDWELPPLPARPPHQKIELKKL